MRKSGLQFMRIVFALSFTVSLAHAASLPPSLTEWEAVVLQPEDYQVCQEVLPETINRFSSLHWRGVNGVIWLDRDDLRYYLGSIATVNRAKLEEFLAKAKGLRLTRTGQSLLAQLEMTEKFELKLRTPEETADKQVYAVNFPVTTTIEIVFEDEGVLVASVLNIGSHPLKVKAKSSGLPDDIWLRKVIVNLEAGKIEVKAGVLGNVIAVSLHAKLSDLLGGAVPLK